MKDLERRTVAFDEIRVEKREDGKPLMVGHAAIFNQLSEDLGGFRELIMPGAFAEAIEKDDVRALWNHNPDYVLGRKASGTLLLAEDARGLAIEILPPDTQIGRDLLTLMERSDVNQMSFGFQIRPGGQDWAKDDNGQVVRTLKRVRLLDVSPVTFPAYPQTEVGVRELRSWLESSGLEKRFTSDVQEAVKWLKKAIARHERHMNGDEPTTGAAGEKSQQKMMDEMKNALAALDDEAQVDSMRTLRVRMLRRRLDLIA